MSFFFKDFKDGKPLDKYSDLSKSSPDFTRGREIYRKHKDAFFKNAISLQDIYNHDSPQIFLMTSKSGRWWSWLSTDFFNLLSACCRAFSGNVVPPLPFLQFGVLSFPSLRQASNVRVASLIGYLNQSWWKKKLTHNFPIEIGARVNARISAGIWSRHDDFDFLVIALCNTRTSLIKLLFYIICEVPYIHGKCKAGASCCFWNTVTVA